MRVALTAEPESPAAKAFMATAERVAQLRGELGLDEPLPLSGNAAPSGIRRRSAWDWPPALYAREEAALNDDYCMYAKSGADVVRAHYRAARGLAPFSVERFPAGVFTLSDGRIVNTRENRQRGAVRTLAW